MTGTLLLLFFFVAPAVVAAVASRDMVNPVARGIMFWGGVVFALLALGFLGPTLFCSGSPMAGYGDCALAGGLNSALPALTTGAMAYVFAGPVLAGLALLLERRSRRI